MKKKLIEILTLILLYLLLGSYTKAENKIEIKYQIENEILTNLDFLNEEKHPYPPCLVHAEHLTSSCLFAAQYCAHLCR